MNPATFRLSRSQTFSLFLAAVGIVTGIQFWQASSPRENERIEATESPAEAARAASPAANNFPATPQSDPAPGDEQEPREAETSRPPPLPLESASLAWERQLADVDARQRDAVGRARAILELLPTLPEEAQAEAAQRAVEHLPDAYYAAVARPVATDRRTHGAAMSALFADLLARPDFVALPTLLAIARDPAHPFSGPALDDLRLLLGADFGENWANWDAAIASRLAGKNQ